MAGHRVYLTITLLVLLGAMLYFFAGETFGAPVLTVNRLAFWALMVWLALVWFCPLFILAWRMLAELNARTLTGQVGTAKKTPSPPHRARKISPCTYATVMGVSGGAICVS